MRAGRRVLVQRKEIGDDYFLTSKESRRALPKSMNANTSSMMAMPGSMARYASLSMIYA